MGWIEAARERTHTTSATDAAIICLTGARPSERGRAFFMVSYVEKKAAARKKWVKLDDIFQVF